MTRPVYLVAARRTPVAPVGGAFKALGVAELGAPVIRAVLADAGLDAASIDQVILGNALYGGGNPARPVALAAGLPETTPALTLDTQCCSGLDALRLGAQAIASGRAEAVLAGGVESTSRRAIRQHRPVNRTEAPVEYERPPFTPWPERDPDMAEAAARLADAAGLSPAEQNAWAMESHRKALAARAELETECVPLAGLSVDAASRELSRRLAERTPVIARHGEGAINVAGTALQADAAAVGLLVSEAVLARLGPALPRLRWLADRAGAGAADQPPSAPVAVVKALLASTGLTPADFASIELMEAYAAQALHNAQELDLPLDRLNRGGGALARGHPIGASGAILAVRAFSQARTASPGFRALLAIAAAGGLASAAVLEAD